MAKVPMIIDDEDENNPELLAQKIAEGKKAIEEAKTQLAEVEKEIEEIDEEEKKLIQAARELRQKRQAKQNKQAKHQHDVSLYESQINKLKAEYQAAIADKVKADQWAKLSAELDEIARTQHWFGAIKSYQFDAAKQAVIVGGRMIDADKPGLGKSITSLAAADLLGAKRIVIISKKEIIRNLEREVRKWAPWRTSLSIVSVTKGFRDTVLRTFEKTDEWTILLNFESWRKDRSIIEKINALQPDTVIVDEAHHMKEIDRLNARGVIDIVYAHNQCRKCGAGKDKLTNLSHNSWRCVACYEYLADKETHSVKNVIPMTGSPVLNRPDEIFPLLHLLDRSYWPNKNMFLTRYCIKEDYRTLTGSWSKRWRFTTAGEKRLMQELGPMFIQRTRDEVGLELPDQEIQVYDLELSRETHPKQYEAYHTLVQTEGFLYNEKGEGFLTAARIITTILRWRQAAVWPAGITLKDPDDPTKTLFKCDVEESVKLDKAFELTQELVAAGERVVLFSKFVGPLNELQRRFDETLETSEPIRAICYYGATPGHKRMEIQEDFDRSTTRNGEHKYDIVLCHYDSAGEGLNFTNATDMIIIDEDWSDQKNFQAYQRIQRIGQESKTTVHILRLIGTIDEEMARMIADKKDQVASFEDNARIVRKVIERLRSKR